MEGKVSLAILLIGCFTFVSAVDDLGPSGGEDSDLVPRIVAETKNVDWGKRMPRPSLEKPKKKAPKYNFGLGKRTYDGLDEAYDENSYFDEEELAEPEMYDGEALLADKRHQQQLQHLYSFGLGKRGIRYDFGLGRRSGPYDFGLGKRTHRFNFGLGKRNGGPYSFGLGKRFADFEMDADSSDNLWSTQSRNTDLKDKKLSCMLLKNLASRLL